MKRKIKAFYDIKIAGNIVGNIGHSYFYNSIPDRVLLSELTLYPSAINNNMIKSDFAIYKEIYNMISPNDEGNNNIALIIGAFVNHYASQIELSLSKQSFEIILFPSENTNERAFLLHFNKANLNTPHKLIQMETNSKSTLPYIRKYSIETPDELILNDLYNFITN